jgi:cysteine synthase
VFYLLHEEGFFVGASSGLNVSAAVEVLSLVHLDDDNR